MNVLQIERILFWFNLLFFFPLNKFENILIVNLSKHYIMLQNWEKLTVLTSAPGTAYSSHVTGKFVEWSGSGRRRRGRNYRNEFVVFVNQSIWRNCSQILQWGLLQVPQLLQSPKQVPILQWATSIFVFDSENQKKGHWIDMFVNQGIGCWTAICRLRQRYRSRLRGSACIEGDMGVLQSGPYGPALLSPWAGVLAKSLAERFAFSLSLCALYELRFWSCYTLTGIQPVWRKSQLETHN